MKFELEVVRFDVVDVVTASGCQKVFETDILE